MATLLLARISWAYLSTGQYKRGTNVTSQPPLIYLLHISFSIPSSKDEWSVECQGYWLYLASEDTDYIGLCLHDLVRNVVVHFPCLYLHFPCMYLYFHGFVWNAGCAFPRFPLLWRGFISLEADLLGRLASRLDFFCNPVSAILLHWLFITICEIYWNLYIGTTSSTTCFFALLDPRYICKGCL